MTLLKYEKEFYDVLLLNLGLFQIAMCILTNMVGSVGKKLIFRYLAEQNGPIITMIRTILFVLKM